MLQKVANLLKGQIRIHIESGFPERILNICGEYGIRFRELQWESPTAFSFTIDRRELRRLRDHVKGLDCDLTVGEQRGAPVFLRRLRRRYGLTAGLLLSLTALVWASFFIWDFEITGNDRISDTEILRALEKNGVGIGTYGYAVNSPSLRNDMLLDVPELSYIAVNVRGCRAYVQVRERVHPPEMVQRREPGNTVAAKDAIIRSVEPLDGEKQVLPGTTVQEGQLLISGVVENGYSGCRCLRGMGRVMGETWYTLRCGVPLAVQKKVYTGETVETHSLLCGKKRINLHFNSSIPQGKCDKITRWKSITLPGGVALPLTLVTETYRPYGVVEERRSPDTALRMGRELLTERLQGYMDEGTVLSERLETENRGDILLITLHAACEEQIGRFVKLPKE